MRVRHIVIQQIVARYLVDLNVGLEIEESLFYTVVRQSRDEIAIRSFIQDVIVKEVFANRRR